MISLNLLDNYANKSNRYDSVNDKPVYRGKLTGDSGMITGEATIA